MVLTGLSIIALVLYAYRTRLTAAEADIRRSLITSSLTPSVFATSMIVAIWSPRLATFMWLLVAVVHILADPIMDRLSPTSSKEVAED